jgi:hypothetical protein
MAPAPAAGISCQIFAKKKLFCFVRGHAFLIHMPPNFG